MAAVIEIDGLRKAFPSRRGQRVALDGLDLEVQAGQLHGFLGPNGSGKTTTLRTMLGLVRADSGRIQMLGYDIPRQLPRAIGTIGAVMENPRFFGNFTARRTLRLLATAGKVKRQRVDEVLETVGLRDRATEQVRSYSLGMRQRLAVAAALLPKPKLLLLDEPANGLDPAGIRHMRDLLRSVASSGVTILLSSHILAEVQQICDSVSIISQGRRITHGQVNELVDQHDQGDVKVKVDDLAGAARIISDAGLPVRTYHDHLIVSDLADPAWITEALAKRRMFVSELAALAPTLESIFLASTGTMPEPGQPSQVDDALLPPEVPVPGQQHGQPPAFGSPGPESDSDLAPLVAGPQPPPGQASTTVASPAAGVRGSAHPNEWWEQDPATPRADLTPPDTAGSDGEEGRR